MPSLTPLPKRITSDNAYVQRAARYAENRRYYAGEQTRGRRARGVRGLTVRNYTALFIDTATAHMGSPRISWGDDELANAHEEHYAAVMAAHDGELFEYETETACAVDGDAAVKVTWDDQERRVRLQRVDPATIWIEGRPDDPLATETVAQRYTLSIEDAPVMFGGQLVTSFGSRRKATITEGWRTDTWEVWLEDELMLSERNPYGFIPYIVFPNFRGPADRWGTSDGQRIREQQDTKNQTGSDTDNLARVSGNIVTVSGADDGDLAVEPGAVWYLPEGARADVLDVMRGNLLEQRIAYEQHLEAELHALARIPKTALGEAGNAPSGLALQVQLGPLVRLVHRKRLTRSAALRSRARYIAALGTKFGGLPEIGDRLPTVLWDDPIPSDRSDDLSNAETEVRLGRSVRAVLASIGVEDPDAELAARRQEIADGLAAPVNTPGVVDHGTGNPHSTGV